MRGAGGFEARVITFGAALQALIVPDAKGHCDDVVLGQDDLAGYLANRRFFGATVGRYANRIANARFVLDGEAVQLTANNGKHALHGGPDGFDRKLWQIAEVDDGAEPGVTLAYASAHGEESYPGRLEVRVTYRVTGPSRIVGQFRGAHRPADDRQPHQPQLFQSRRCRVGRKHSRSSPDRCRRSLSGDRSRGHSAARAAAAGCGNAVRFPRRVGHRFPDSPR